MITMLDEKFRLTEVMGYTIEADKQRAQLNNLIRQDHAMLTPSLWAEVDKAYQQMLPGLTVWQASARPNDHRGATFFRKMITN